MALSHPDFLTVLIVDDNEDLLEFLKESLSTLTPYVIVTAKDGEEGLTRFFEARPDCVIIDAKMPVLDGFQLVRALRGDQDSAVTPLIMLTALNQDQERFVGLASGADQYLLKPISIPQLLTAIEQAMIMGERLRHEQLNALADVTTTQEEA